jgi:hypothetical protein
MLAQNAYRYAAVAKGPKSRPLRLRSAGGLYAQAGRLQAGIQIPLSDRDIAD